MADPDHRLRTALAERDACAQELFESRRFAATLAVDRQTLADALAAAANAASAIDAALQARDRAVRARDAAVAERDRARAAAHDAQAMLHRLTSSTSWRLTAPVRVLLMRILRRQGGA